MQGNHPHSLPKGTDHGPEIDFCLSTRITLLSVVHPFHPSDSVSQWNTHEINTSCQSTTRIQSHQEEITRSSSPCSWSNHPYSSPHWQDYSIKLRSNLCKSQQHHHSSSSFYCLPPTKPPVPKIIFAALDGTDDHPWYQALFHQYEKNAKIGLYSRPHPTEETPKGMKICRLMITYSTSKTMVKNFWNSPCNTVLMEVVKTKDRTLKSHTTISKLHFTMNSIFILGCQ